MTPPTPAALVPLDDSRAIDLFIAARMPAWLRSASAQNIEKLHAALREHQAQQVLVADLLGTVQPIEAFALERLKPVLDRLSTVPADATQALWRDIRLRVEQPLFPVTEVDLPTFTRYARDSNLLQRMLLNFSAAQAQASYHYPGSGIVRDGELLPVPPETVAQACRRLDLGAAYQQHLGEVFEPSDSAARERVLYLLAQDRLYTLRAHVYRSHLRGDIDEGAQQVFERMLAPVPEVVLTQMALPCRALEVLGFAVPQAMVFDGGDGTDPGPVRWHEPGLDRSVVLYIGNDPKKPLRQHVSWQQLSDELTNDLKDPAYRDFFTRLLAHDDRMGFDQRLSACLLQQHPELELVAQPAVPVTLASLVRQQIARIRADAAAMIVSTEAADQAVHQRRMATLEAAGLAAFGLAASFIPGIGELMLAELAWGTVKEVYEGGQDWSQGQREQALAHFFAVARNLALAATTTGTVVLAAGALRRSTFVDGLTPVRRDDGAERLWNPDLAAYASPEPPGLRRVGEDGLIHAQGRRWWRNGAYSHEVQRDGASSHWRIVHPGRSSAYRPWLRGNGDGVWWIQGDSPLEWRDLIPLLRRFGPHSDLLTDEARDQAVTVAGYDEANIRALLAEERPAPPPLALALDHAELDAAIDRFFAELRTVTSTQALDPVLCSNLRQLPAGVVKPRSAELAVWRANAEHLRYALFEHAARLREPSLDPAASVLRQGFPTLPGRIVQAIVDEARAGDRQVLERDGRIPLTLSEEARVCLRENRVARAVEGLCLNNVWRADSMRLVFALLRRMPQWPAGLNIELREDGLLNPSRERLLGLSETRETKVLVRVEGQFQVFDEQGVDQSLALAPAGSLYEALLVALGEPRAQALGWSGPDAASTLHRTLRKAALNDRQHLASLLGIAPRAPSFRPPSRMRAGQVGYLLSGRGRLGQRSLTTMVRSLYPGFDDLDVSSFLSRLQAESPDPMGTLLRYAGSLRSLEQTLNLWQQQAAPFHLSSRRRVAAEILRCWRRQSPPMFDVDGQILGYRLSVGHVAIGELPVLPDDVDFSHVVELNLSEAGQTQQLDGFLRRFTGLRWLDLSGNGCTDLMPALGHMPNLRELVLNDNPIVLSDAGGQTLSYLPLLEVLSMDRAPLGRAPDLRQLNHLRRVSLRRTGLTELPEGLLTRPFLEVADLRSNHLETLPESFFAVSERVRSSVILHGNPLDLRIRSRLWPAEEGLQVPAAPEPAIGVSGRLRQRWLDGAEGEQYMQLRTCWDDLVPEPGSGAFFGVLEGLLNSAEYRLATKDLQARVWRMLQGAAESAELREDLFTLAASPLTCVDSVLSSFSALEVRLQLFKVRASAAPGQEGVQLLRFARQLFRLDSLEQQVRRDITGRVADGRGVDEVEVSLAYRTRLARELDLPGQSTHMDYHAVAGVTPQLLRDAAAAVRLAEAGEALEPFIASRDFWQAWLREQYAAAFSDLEEDFWRRLDGLTSRQAYLPEGEYMQGINRLANEREAALQGLARRLTHDALQQSEPT